MHELFASGLVLKLEIEFESAAFIVTAVSQVNGELRALLLTQPCSPHPDTRRMRPPNNYVADPDLSAARTANFTPRAQAALRILAYEFHGC